MIRSNWTVRQPLLALAALAIAGCANVKPTHSGYLSDYSQVQADPNHHKLEIHHANSIDLQNIDSFYIEEVAWKSPRPKGTVAHPDRQTSMLKSLREALQKDLATIKPVVDSPGPHTARVHAAITDEVDSEYILNILASIVAGPVSNGGATVEAEILAPDGHQIAAVSVARAGGLFDVLGYYLPHDHAKQACRTASRDLRTALTLPNTPPEEPHFASPPTPKSTTPQS
ncbi:MAG: DUF3313 family protein [Bacillota bacterium]